MPTTAELRKVQKELLKKLAVTTKREGIAKTKEAIRNTKGELRKTFETTLQILHMKLPE